MQFLPQSKVGHRGVLVRMRDLDEEATYILQMDDGIVKKSGSYLMNHGLELRLTGDYASTLIRFAKRQIKNTVLPE